MWITLLQSPGVLVLVQCAWAAVTWLLAHKHVAGCDLDERMGVGGSVYDCAV